MFWKDKLDKVLTDTQKYTGLDNVYFFNSSFFLGLKFFFQSLSGLIISVAFTRLSTTYIYGQYNLFISIISIIGLVSLPGLSLALTQSVSKGYYSSLKNAFLSSFKYSFLSLPFLLCIYLYFMFKGDIQFSYSFLIAAIFFPLLYSTNLFDYFLIGIKEYKKSAFYSFFISLLIVFTMVLSITLWPTNVNAIITTYLAASSVPALFVTFNIINKIKSKKRDFGLLNYGKFLTFTINLLPVISNYLDKIIVAYLLGVNLLAFYVVAQIIPENIKNLLKVLSSSLIPKLSLLNEEEFLMNFKRHFLKLILIGAALTFVSWILMPLAISIIFSNKYEGSIAMARVLSLTLIFYPSINTILQKLYAHKNKKNLTIFTIVTNLIKIVIYVIFIPIYGLTGLVWGLVLYSFINFLILLVLTIKNDTSHNISVELKPIKHIAI